MPKGVYYPHNKPWLGKHRGEATRKKLSESLKRYYSNPLNRMKTSIATKKGMTTEVIRRISLKNKGSKRSSEIKLKMSLANKGQVPWIKGKHHRIDTIKKLSEKIKIARRNWITPLRDTLPERKVQQILNELNIKYKTHWFINIKHIYRTDIFIPNLNLVIEIDGKYWHNYPHGTYEDAVRTCEMKEKKYLVSRLWEDEIDKERIQSILIEADYLKNYQSGLHSNG